MHERNGERSMIHIWDSSGEDTYREFVIGFMKKVQAIILVYDQDDEDTYNEINELVNQIHENASHDVVVFIVSNSSYVNNPSIYNENEEKQIYTCSNMETAISDFTKIDEFHLNKEFKYYEIQNFDHLQINEMFNKLLRKMDKWNVSSVPIHIFRP